MKIIFGVDIKINKTNIYENKTNIYYTTPKLIPRCFTTY